jgi:hypothetical protein
VFGPHLDNRCYLTVSSAAIAGYIRSGKIDTFSASQILLVNDSRSVQQSQAINVSLHSFGLQSFAAAIVVRFPLDIPFRQKIR